MGKVKAASTFLLSFAWEVLKIIVDALRKGKIK